MYGTIFKIEKQIKGACLVSKNELQSVEKASELDKSGVNQVFTEEFGNIEKKN